jgi:hypothetical protein
VLKAAIVALAGVAVVNTVGNVVKVIGITIVLLYAITVTQLGVKLAVLGGTATGLVLGLPSSRYWAIYLPA